MTVRKLTERQRQAIECLEGARSAGMALSAYVRSRGLELRTIYDAIAALRRSGALPAAQRKSKKKPRFVAVRVAAQAAGLAGHGALRCRVLIGRGAVIECGEWPPSEWLAALLAERSGAAT